MKDIVWTIMLAAVLMFAITVARSGLPASNTKDRHVADLQVPPVASATTHRVSKSRTTEKPGTEQRVGERQKIAVSTAMKHEIIQPDEDQSGSSAQGASAPSESISEKRHQAPVKSFLAQVTPEALNRFKQAQNKVPSAWDGHNSILDGTDEIDTADLFHRLQGITESR